MSLTATRPRPARVPVATLRQPAVVASLVAVVCLALGAVLLVVPAPITFDAWAWLVWGRELAHLDLDTSGGPSWKPLPVLVTAVLALAGGAAPVLWLVAARASGLLALVGAYRLAARLGGVLAGVVATVLLFTTPDTEARFWRLLVEGHTAPAEAALWLLAIERTLARRYGTALWLGTALALLRPEAWPFLVVVGAWGWWRAPRLRWQLVAVAVVVPLLWFGGDWWGSGDPWRGAELAQVGPSGTSARLTVACGRVGQMVPVPVWIAAVAGAVEAWRRRERLPAALLALGLAWAAVVVAMALLGYAALGRFLLPAAALVCVVAAGAVSRLVTTARTRASGIARGLVVLALSVPFAVPRLDLAIQEARESRAASGYEHDIDDAIAQAGGAATLRACGPVTVERLDVVSAVLPAVAWKLDVPLSRVFTGSPAVTFAVAGGALDATLASAGGGPPSRLLGESDRWRVYASTACPTPGSPDSWR